MVPMSQKRASKDVDTPDSIGITPLWDATAKGLKKSVRRLINAKANLYAEGVGGMSPLATAAMMDAVEIVQLFINAGVDVNRACNSKVSSAVLPLQFASMSKSPRTVAALLAAGAKTDISGVVPPLYLAIQHDDNIESVDLLIAAGAQLTYPSIDACPFYASLDYRNVKALKTLIKAKADVNAHPDAELHPIHIAVHEHDDEMVQLLISANVNLNVRNSQGFTSLDIASMPLAIQKCGKTLLREDAPGDSDIRGLIVDMLIAAKADVSAKSSDGSTPLMHAATHNRYNLMTKFIAAGADIEDTDKQGLTALVHAVRASAYGAVSTLLRANADVQVRYKNDYSLIYEFEARCRHAGILHDLIDAGLDINRINDADEQNESTLDCVLSEGNRDFAKVMQDAGALDWYQIMARKSEFIRLAHVGALQQIQQMIATASDFDKEVALTVAAKHGHRQLVLLLLKHGVDPSCRQGPTVPLAAARVGGYLQIEHDLKDAGATASIDGGFVTVTQLFNLLNFHESK